jgi:hypothetical protein
VTLSPLKRLPQKEEGQPEEEGQPVREFGKYKK